MKKLTIGSAVYDDFDGVYFSYQSIRLNNQDIWDDLDLLIIDNNPESDQGKATKDFCEKTKHIRYIPYTEKTSTAVRNEIFFNAQGEFCMSIDCHVLFEPDTIKKLIKYFEENPDTKDLFHGPMFYDVINGHAPCTHMKPEWRDHMFGTWGVDQRGTDPNNPPFEIPMHGLGVFACRTDAWLKFHPDFSGFGGEEGYIHNKYKRAGRQTWCLPFLRWLHRFQRPAGVKYPLVLKDRIKNYLIGNVELGLPIHEIINHFSEKHPNMDYDKLLSEAQDINMMYTGNQKFFDLCKVQFQEPVDIRYIKYKILMGKEGRSRLKKVEIFPPPKKMTIHSCTSENNKSAPLLLAPYEAWESHPKDDFKFPHEIIVDLNEICKVSTIITHGDSTIKQGGVTNMKIYAGTTVDNFEEVSEVKVFD